MDMWVPGNPNDRSVLGFRIRHGGARGPMSVKQYITLKKAGRGPRETVVGDVVKILPEDERAFDDACRNPTEEEAARVAATRARWRKRALRAGAASKKSPIHVSKLKLGRSKRPPPRASQSKQRRSR
jgi:hypothetical protein